jgi:hypothetical protein
MYDLKPAAPAEIRGPYRPIASNVPGLDLCELMPRQARLLDKLALIRSLHHLTDEHAAGMHWVLTGYDNPAFRDNSAQPSHPAVGSEVARLRGANRPGMVPYVHIAPDPMGIPMFLRVHEAAYLGARYAPLAIESARAKPDQQRYDLNNLISKVHFQLPSVDLLPGLDWRRLEDRERLRRHLDGLGRRLDQNAVLDGLDHYQQQALQMVSSPSARRAFDLGREDPRTRAAYGLNVWGQGLLLCRRLVEAGVTFVTLNTDSFSAQWDNHSDLKRHFDEMLPVYDQMLTALIEDLCQRGLYERVLVLVWGEFGRTPKMNAGGGRDHYGRAGFALLGGGGLRGGTVVGSTTPRGDFPRDRPVWPGDVLATVYHVLGIDPSVEFPDHFGRPMKVLGSGEVIRDLL